MYQLIKRKFIGRVQLAFAMTVAIVLLSACATAPVVPEAQLIAAREAIANAEQAGARRYAAAELDEAQQQLVKAERSVSTEQMLEAERFAQQAQVAAKLATARTEAAKAAEINREMARGVEALIEEMQRSGDQQ